MLDEISERTFKQLSSLTDLDLSNNQIQKIFDGSFADLENVTNLNLNLNDIASLDDYVFRGLISLEDLVLQQNNIKFISQLAFKGLENLKTLNLKQNNLAEFPTKSLRVLPSLTTLYAGKNPISSLERGVLKGMSSLRHLWLEKCQIKTVARRAFNDKNLQTLVLEKNNLTRLPNLGRLKELRILYLDENPWQCDRSALPMLAWLQRHNMMESIATCANPVSRRGRNLLSFSPEELERTETVETTTVTRPSFIYTNADGDLQNRNSTTNQQITYQYSLYSTVVALANSTPPRTSQASFSPEMVDKTDIVETLTGSRPGSSSNYFNDYFPSSSSTNEKRNTRSLYSTITELINSTTLKAETFSKTHFSTNFGAFSLDQDGSASYESTSNYVQTSERKAKLTVSTSVKVTTKSSKITKSTGGVRFSVIIVISLIISAVFLILLYFGTRKIIKKCNYGASHFLEDDLELSSGKSGEHCKKIVVSTPDPRKRCRLKRQMNGRRHRAETTDRSTANGEKAAEDLNHAENNVVGEYSSVI